jgi:glycosyltransferase involved in cell wall biosynthesis
LKKVRVLWLLNHTTLRKFEVDQLKASGVNEIFMPKSFPYSEGNLSANVDYSHDSELTIPQEAIALLNAQDWYASPSDEAWAVANEFFDVAIIGFFPGQIDAATRCFEGAIILRVFGLSKGYSYSKLLYDEVGSHIVRRIKLLGSRFWFGAGYAHLKNCERHFIASRDCFLPVGLKGELSIESWEGKLDKILFVCPRIGTSPYFENIYNQFIKDFAEFDYSIGGAQPIPVKDPSVLGYVSSEQHDFNMKQHRVMFYHSTEPNHIHYHPFEAIRVGMPLLFMAGGMLDLMGGMGLPGRCSTIAEAQKKARRIMDGDTSLVEAIQKSQIALLAPMTRAACEQPWQAGFQKVLLALQQMRNEPPRPPKKKRIGIVVPVEYRGGSLRGAKLLAEAVYEGGRQAGESVEVVLLHLDKPESYPPEEFDDFSGRILTRPFKWKFIDGDAARRAMRYAGYEGWEPKLDKYSVVDDGINQLEDCDLWIIVSDRISTPLLPIRPTVLMVYDYLQRYVNILPDGADQPYLEAARSAIKVLVTTEFTRQDALQYAGVTPAKVAKLPMLSPDFSGKHNNAIETRTYFLWTTNAAWHKNHENALKALKYYYEELDGRLFCHVTGVGTDNLLKGAAKHLKPLKNIVEGSPALKSKLKWLGELPDRNYQHVLANSAFLWHAGLIDNGTFSVVEAAGLEIPSLSSDYPAMREIDAQFSLNLSWMNARQPKHMASQLKEMELSYVSRRELLPTSEQLASQSVPRLASAYWQVIRKCL